MQMHLIVTPEMKPVPEDITVIENYGDTTIMTQLEGYVTGDHMVIEGTEEAVKNWLRPFDGVWVGNGNPMMEQFQAMHIGD